MTKTMKKTWPCAKLFHVSSLVVIIALAGLVESPVNAQQPTPEQIRALQALDPEAARELQDRLRGLTAGQQQALEFPNTMVPASDTRPTVPKVKKPTISANSEIVVAFQIKPSLINANNPNAALNRTEITSDALLGELLGSHAYKIDHQGMLNIRGLADIYLSGLSAKEAGIRIAAEPGLQRLNVSVTILPVKAIGQASLRPFGYKLFDDVPSTFAPATDIPVPPDYVIGPGDNVIVSLFGNVNEKYSLVVNREGIIDFPDLGPISVIGMNFSQLRSEIEQQVAQKMIGSEVSVTMGELRSIQIYVLGDVVRPGSYTVSGLSTVTNALFASGGVSPIGSLRRIEHKRNGRLLKTLDLYELLLAGDTSSDNRLLPGDVIFVPPIGQQVSVGGAVIRPAIYELKKETTVDQVIKLAGGLLPDSDPTSAKIFRIDENLNNIVINLNLRNSDEASQHVFSGDFIEIPTVLVSARKFVTLTGHVNRAGDYQWFEGLRVSHLFPTTDVLRPQADLNYALIRRQAAPDKPVEALSVDLEAALRAPGQIDDLRLMPRDELIIFDLVSGRDRLIDPILQDLKLQASNIQSALEVRVGGLVRVPGRYPLEQGMTVSDLIRAGGGLAEAAYAVQAELARYDIEDRTIRVVELVTVDLAGVLNGNVESDISLQSYDYLTIKQVTDWGDQGQVRLEGEFRFPGTYQIRKGETLSSVIERAGGFTAEAFPRGAVFTRVSLREREQEQLNFLARRLEIDLTTTAMVRIQDSPGAAQAAVLAESLVEQLRKAKAIGRLVVDLEKVSKKNVADIELQNGDTIKMPLRPQEVTVIGEVQFPTSHLFSQIMARDDYIENSGGLTRNADKKKIYVVKANGSVIATRGSKWFGKGSHVLMEPGDTIVVPLNAGKISKLRLVTSVTQVIFQLGVLAAAATR